jgi:hypothetical protein
MKRCLILLAAIQGSVLVANSSPGDWKIEVLHNRMLVATYVEGRVLHHGKGQKRTDEKVEISPLDVAAATNPTNFQISSPDDPKFSVPVSPSKIYRKSKGTAFAWFVDKWENNRAVNDRPDHTKTHWLYLPLESPLQPGKTYQISNRLSGIPVKIVFQPLTSVSEAVHTNLLGYVPAAKAKFGYLYHWAGDLGGIDFAPWAEKRFWLADETGQSVFEGKVKFRKKSTDTETGQTNDTPNANYQGADVYECDFSAFKTPGSYRLVIDGVGASQKFRLADDAYRQAYVTIARGLYHNRSGIELKKPFTELTRPAPHRVGVSPGFQLKYTRSRMIDWKNEDASADDKPAIEAGLVGNLEAWGWYQDAGDWDSYPSHLRVPQELLLAFEIQPENFRDGDLNIPESGNGIPDIVDEAAWLPRFCHRLRQELITKKYGSGGIGLRVCGDHFGGDGEGVPSYEDNQRLYIASGEDPVATFRYAGVAAMLARTLKSLGKSDPEKVDWEREARESFAWAKSNTKPQDEAKVKPHRLFAAASLWRLTGENSFAEIATSEAADLTATTFFTVDNQYGPMMLALHDATQSTALTQRMKAAILHTANFHVDSANRRALRFGGDFFMPMLIGHLTTPLVLPVAVATKLEPDDSDKYWNCLYTTADYFLGTNSLNMTWATGLGPRHPREVFHMDAWYNGKGKFHPGIVPYGPWIKAKDEGQGPWDHDWANKTVYPKIDQWPGGERWFDNRGGVLNSEFTVHQNSGPAAAIFGILAGRAKS